MQIDITSLDTEQNFWQVYPEFKVVEPFKSLYTGDKSKQKENSSRICWFIAICYHPSSGLSRMPKDGKDGAHAVVGEDYLENKEFYQQNLAVLTALIPKFEDMTMRPMQRQLRMFERKLEEREAFIRDTPYTEDNWKKLDDALAATDKVEGTYKKLERKLQEEGEGGTIWGDQEESATEKGDI